MLLGSTADAYLLPAFGEALTDPRCQGFCRVRPGNLPASHPHLTGTPLDDVSMPASVRLKGAMVYS